MCVACISSQHSKYTFPKSTFFFQFSIIFTWRHTAQNCQSHYWKFPYRRWCWYLLESYAIKKFCWNRHRKSLDLESIDTPFTSLHWFQFFSDFLFFFIVFYYDGALLVPTYMQCFPQMFIGKKKKCSQTMNLIGWSKLCIQINC